MDRKPIGEEYRQDHLHLTVNLIIPDVSSDQPPALVVTTARHVNNHLVGTGPLLALALPDIPLPMPQMPLLAYLAHVLVHLRDELGRNADLVVYGGGTKKIPARLLPAPVPPPIELF